MQSYKIRKNWNSITTTYWWVTSGIILMIIPIIMVWFICNQVTINKLSDLITFSPVLIFVFIWLLITLKGLKYQKVKNYKKSWWWIIEKVKITSINVYHARDNVYNSHNNTNISYPYYYAEADRWDTIYCSEAFSKWHIWWTSLGSIQKIYLIYGVQYDNDQTHKQELLQEINRRISDNQYNLENWWFLKRIASKVWNNYLEGQKKIIEEWYQPPYWEINWRKISVWDTVDVYIDPDDPNNYWMDIDFLFNK